MPSIEDAILSSQANQIRREESEAKDFIEEDDLGITLKCPIKDMPDKPLGRYLAYRVWARNRLNKQRLIYIDAYGAIRQGEEEIEETKDNLLMLAAASFTRPGATAYAWEELHNFLPRLNKDIIQVFPGLLFNRETGELTHTDGKEFTI